MKTTRVYYGWVIVAVAGLGLFFSGPGRTYGISVFIGPYAKRFAQEKGQAPYLQLRKGAGS